MDKKDLGICVLLLTLFLSLVLPSILSFSETSDEGWLIQTAKEVTKTRKWDTYNSVRHPPLSYYTYAFVLSNDDSDLVSARIMMLIYPLLLGVGIYWFTKSIFGTIPATAALFLYATNPSVLAHSSLVTTDICAAFGFFLGFTVCSKGLSKDNKWFSMLGGLCLGLALLAKYTGVLLIPVLAALALFPKPTLKKSFHLGMMFLVGLLLLNLAYGFTASLGQTYEARSLAGKILTPFSYIPPLIPAPYLIGLDRVSEVMELGHPAYFFGEFTLTNKWYFYPVAFVLKEPLAFLVLLLIGGAVIIKKHWIVIVPIIIPLISFLFLNNNFVGPRHLLVIYPFLFFVCASAFSLKFKPVKLLWILPALQLASILITAPHYLSYFNEAAGGSRHGDQYLLDSNLDWGQDYQKALDLKKSSNRLIKEGPGWMPTTGRIAVNAMDLKGYPGTWKGHEWITAFKPVDWLGNTYRIYDLKTGDFEKIGLNNPVQRSHLGWIHLQQGRINDALRVFRETRHVLGEAYGLLELGDLAGAQKFCLNSPDDPKVLEILCFTLEQRRSLEEAQAWYLKRLAAEVEGAYLAPIPETLNKDSISLNNSGYLAWKGGDKNNAISFFKNAIKKDPLFADPYGNLSALYAQSCEHALLLEYAGKPDQVQLRSHMAKEALRFRDKYLSLCSSAIAWWAKRVTYRGHTVIYPGIYALPIPRSVDALRLLAQNRPLTEDDFRMLGSFYLMGENYQHAMRALLFALKRNAKDAFSLNQLGVIFFKTRLFNQARFVLNQALTLRPDYKEAAASLEYINRYCKDL